MVLSLVFFSQLFPLWVSLSGINYSELSLCVISLTRVAGTELLVGSGVLREISLEVSELAFTAVVNTVLVVLGIELKSRVAADFEACNLVLCGVELGDDKVLNRFDVLGKLIPDGSEGFAVSAPRGVVFNEHVLCGILDNLLPVLSNQSGQAIDGSRLRDWCRLEMRRQLAILKVLHESAHICSGEFACITFPDELQHLLCGRDNAEGW